MMKLMGYKRFSSKKNGKDYCVAEVCSPFSSRELEQGFIGQKVEEVFLPESQYTLLQPEHVGKDIRLDYEFSGNKAYLVNFSIVK